MATESRINLSKPVQTRDGRKARIICTDVNLPNFPVLALIDIGGQEATMEYTADGRYYSDPEEESRHDLVNIEEKKQSFINVYNNTYVCGPYTSHETANAHADIDRVAVIKCIWSDDKVVAVELIQTSN